jgi:hypothetical protein
MLQGVSVISGFQRGQWFGGRAFETRMTRRGAKGTKGGLVFRGFRGFRGFRVSESSPFTSLIGVRWSSTQGIHYGTSVI